jgi:hypothetical protein
LCRAGDWRRTYRQPNRPPGLPPRPSDSRELLLGSEEIDLLGVGLVQAVQIGEDVLDSRAGDPLGEQRALADLRHDDESQPVERRAVLHHQVGGVDDVHLGADQNDRAIVLDAALTEVTEDEDLLAMLTHEKGPFQQNRRGVVVGTSRSRPYLHIMCIHYNTLY